MNYQKTFTLRDYISTLQAEVQSVPQPLRSDFVDHLWLAYFNKGQFAHPEQIKTLSGLAKFSANGSELTPDAPCAPELCSIVIDVDDMKKFIQKATEEARQIAFKIATRIECMREKDGAIHIKSFQNTCHHIVILVAILSTIGMEGEPV